MAKRFTIESVFKAVDRVTAPVSKMQTKVGGFARNSVNNLRKVDKASATVVGGLKKIGAAGVLAFGLVAGAAADVISTGMEFEQTITTAASKFGGDVRRGTEAFKQLELAAREVGSTTEFSASQSAEALNFLAMAGFSAESSIAALPGVVDLATVAQLDLGRATDIASDALGAFGLMSDDPLQLAKNLTKVNDVLAKTSTSANVTVEDMFETLKQAAPPAIALGASVEQFASMVGLLAGNGIKASKAGTDLKNVFVNLAAPAKAGSDALKRIGVKTLDEGGNLRNVVDIFEDIEKATASMGSGARASVLKDIFGKIALPSVMNLFGIGADRIREYQAEIAGADGVTTKMAAGIRDTAQGSFNSLKSAIEGVKISIFSLNRGPIKNTIDSMTGWVRANEELIATKIGDWVAHVADNFEDIVTWVKRIGKGLAVFAAFVVVLKSLIGVLTLVNLLMLANPVTLLVVGIVLLIALVGLLVLKYKDELVAAFQWVAKAIPDAWNGMLEFFRGLWQDIGIATDNFVNWVKRATAPLRFDIMNGITAAWEPLKAFFTDLWADVTAIFDKAMAGLMKGVDTVVKGVTAVSTALGFGDEADETPTQQANRRTRGRSDANAPQVVTQAERTAAAIEERRTVNTSEVTIRDETGRAEVTRGTFGDGLTLEPTGGA